MASDTWYNKYYNLEDILAEGYQDIGRGSEEIAAEKVSIEI